VVVVGGTVVVVVGGIVVVVGGTVVVVGGSVVVVVGGTVVLLDVVVVAPHAGSASPVQVNWIVTALGAPAAPTKVMRNCGSAAAPVKLNGVRSTVPVSSSGWSGIPGIGLPSLSSMAIEPLVYDARAGASTCSDEYDSGTHTGFGGTMLAASTRIAPSPHAPPLKASKF